ncbi:MAG: hypothetical protein WC668_03005 [Patescibacteria group bacterium]|jgi:hypothetical protein
MAKAAVAEKTIEQEIAALEKQIKDRKELVLKYLRFAAKILTGIGELVSRDTSSDHIKTTWKFKGFDNFEFRGIFGMTCFGGNNIEIWFCLPGESIKVFDVYWQHDDDPKVEVFIDTGAWRTPLDLLVDKPDQVIADYRKAKERKLDKKLEEQECQTRLQELQKQAKRLGFQL